MTEILLYLLRLGLWGKEEKHIPLNLTESEWVSIYKLACQQTVEGLVWDGILVLPPEQQPSKDIMIEWGRKAFLFEEENKHQLISILKLDHLFRIQHHLPYIVIKGQSIAELYRNPLHRLCGDIDLWFGNQENQEKANQIIEKTGIPIHKFHYDSDYVIYDEKVENHSFLIELNNPFIKKDIRELEKEIFQKSSQKLDATGSLLLQITHILKHQLGNGVGLRQICDLAISIQKLKYDKDKLKIICKKWGIYKWSQLLFSFINKYLGVNLEDLPFPPSGDAEMLKDEIFQSGNFGHVDKRFGNRPDNSIKKKWYSLRIVWHKTKLFFYYIPSESFWRPFMLFTKGY